MKFIVAAIFVWFSAVQASQAQAEIDVRGNVQDIMDNDSVPSLTDDTDFGYALVNGGLVVHTFVIQNNGTSPLHIISITGGGDFATIGGITSSTYIQPNKKKAFTVTFDPSAVGLRSDTITILNSDADEDVFNFIVQGTGVLSGVSAWDPLQYPTDPCSWLAQDTNLNSGPVASWSVLVAAAEAAGTNAVFGLDADSYVENFNYDGANGNESCTDHQVAATLDLTAAQNGMKILGSSGGCFTFLDLGSASASNQWGNFTGMDTLTIKNIYLRQWGGAINLTNCSHVLIEDCVFEDVNNFASNGVHLTNCTNVTFRRCKFLGNNNLAGHALFIIGSGTAGDRILLEDCEFGCNVNGIPGAALAVGAGSFVQITGGTFSGNSSGAAGRGGAVYVGTGADVVFTKADFIGNKAPGIVNPTDGGGAIFVDGNSNIIQTTALIDSCNFFKNTGSASAMGGAIVCLGNAADITKSSCTIQHSKFDTNGADKGGAVMAQDAEVVFDDNEFINNQSSALANADNSAGGAIAFQGSAGDYTITNNTFTGNLGPAGSTAIDDDATGSAFVITGNLLDANPPVQTENLPVDNSGGTAGSSTLLTSLAAVALNFDCSSGAYCSATLSATCLSNAQSAFICSPAAGVSGSISGEVWDDINGNGIQEVGDTGIANVYVLLIDEMGFVAGRTTTDAAGNYAFSGITPGNYHVVYVNPDIPTFTSMTLADASGDEMTDSDHATSSYVTGELRGALSPNVEILGGDMVNDLDAGFTSVIVLPIEMLYFTGTNQDCNANVLQWATATETNNKSFAVERSGDGIHFETLAIIEGAGTSDTEQRYEWADRQVLSGSYYRLKQTDLDGNTSYSGLVFIKSDCNNNSAQVYPNPAHAEVFVQLDMAQAADVKVVISNNFGQVVYNQEYTHQSGVTTMSVPTIDFAAGMYIVQVMDAQHNVFATQKVTIQ